MEFRFKALRHAHDPDDLDTTINLANPKSWIAVFVTLVLIVGAAVWAVIGRLPQTATGHGVLSRTDGVIRVELGYQAVVRRTYVAAGDQVDAGRVLMSVTDGSGAEQDIAAPDSGTVMVADHGEGVVVEAGEPLITLERSAAAEADLTAMIVVPMTQAAGISPGMPVDLSVASAPASVFGLLHGNVAAVSRYPVTAAGLDSLIYDRATVGTLTSAGPVALVSVTLDANPGTASGYDWSSPTGPPYQLSFQSDVSADIHLGERRPIDYVFGDSR